VASRSSQRTGVLVLRLWLEQTDHGLRARITEVADLEEREEVSHVAADPGEIFRIVRAFVHRFIRDAGVTAR
jgi:hypothetical protein